MIIVVILVFVVLIVLSYQLYIISSLLRAIGENTSGLDYLLSLLVREVSNGVIDPTEWEG